MTLSHWNSATTVNPVSKEWRGETIGRVRHGLAEPNGVEFRIWKLGADTRAKFFFGRYGRLKIFCLRKFQPFDEL